MNDARTKITYWDLAPHRLGEVMRRMQADYDAMKAAGKNPAPLSNCLQAHGIFNATCGHYLGGLFDRETVEWEDLTKHCRRKILESFASKSSATL